MGGRFGDADRRNGCFDSLILFVQFTLIIEYFKGMVDASNNGIKGKTAYFVFTSNNWMQRSISSVFLAVVSSTSL